MLQSKTLCELHISLPKKKTPKCDYDFTFEQYYSFQWNILFSWRPLLLSTEEDKEGKLKWDRKKIDLSQLETENFIVQRKPVY